MLPGYSSEPKFKSMFCCYLGLATPIVLTVCFVLYLHSYNIGISIKTVKKTSFPQHKVPVFCQGDVIPIIQICKCYLFEVKKQRYWPQVALTMQLLTIQAKNEEASLKAAIHGQRLTDFP